MRETQENPTLYTVDPPTSEPDTDACLSLEEMGLDFDPAEHRDNITDADSSEGELIDLKRIDKVFGTNFHAHMKVILEGERQMEQIIDSDEEVPAKPPKINDEIFDEADKAYVEQLHDVIEFEKELNEHTSDDNELITPERRLQLLEQMREFQEAKKLAGTRAPLTKKHLYLRKHNKNLPGHTDSTSSEEAIPDHLKKLTMEDARENIKLFIRELLADKQCTPAEKSKLRKLMHKLDELKEQLEEIEEIEETKKSFKQRRSEQLIKQLLALEPVRFSTPLQHEQEEAMSAAEELQLIEEERREHEALEKKRQSERAAASGTESGSGSSATEFYTEELSLTEEDPDAENEAKVSDGTSVENSEELEYDPYTISEGSDPNELAMTKAEWDELKVDELLQQAEGQPEAADADYDAAIAAAEGSMPVPDDIAAMADADKDRRENQDRDDKND